MGEFDYDFFVIGAGSGGVRASRIAAGLGARVAVAESYRVGGTCVIRGCVPKKLLGMAGLQDVYTASNGHTRTTGNYIKAVYQALSKTYGFLTPNLWTPSQVTKDPFQEFTDYLAMTAKKH